MRWADLIVLISRPIGKLGKRFTMDVNVVFRPLSAQCFIENTEIKKQDEIFIGPAIAADNGFPFFLEKFFSW